MGSWCGGRVLRSRGVAMATEQEPTNRAHARERSTPEIHATWRRGPRTKAWDDLWRWLLSDPPRADEGAERRTDPVDEAEPG